jgi:hypothetical protein
MIWTEKAPTVEGWYWFRWKEETNPERWRVVNVYGYQSDPSLFGASGENFDLFNLSLGEWAGPLMPPEERGA